MFWSKADIVERLSKIPRTLEDISIEIFGGVPATNDFLHKESLSRENCTDAPYICRNPQSSISLEQVSIEQELMHPYIDSSLSNEFAINATQYKYMLPYEILGNAIKKDYRIFQPEELEAKFPVAYKQLIEIKQKSWIEEQEPVSVDCYRLENESFLQYMKTPKIIITEHCNLQASYDPQGNHVFADGVGVVLGDHTLYYYVTAVLNSSISKAFPEIWNHEKMQIGIKISPEMLRRFPIIFPRSGTTEILISTITCYLIYLNRQKYLTKTYCIPGYQDLIDFYKRISDLLILDCYLTNDLDPKLLEILVENITPSEEQFEYTNDINLLIGLQAIKKNILDSPDFRRCRFSNEFTNILATLKNSSVW
jgi:hypothetical protein